MSITLNELYHQSNVNYEMQQLAGLANNDTIVQWVHTLEDVVACEYLRGGELVFTTGIGHQERDWLTSFAKILKEKDASGLVINEGPYIKKIPEDLIQLCNQLELPLFVIPWKTHLVDITRDFSNQIIKSEEIGDSIATSLKNFIFYPNERKKAVTVLQRFGYQETAACHLIAIRLENPDDKETLSDTRRNIENITRKRKIKYALFSYDPTLYLLVFDLDQSTQIKLVQDLLKIHGEEPIAVSGKMNSFTEISSKYSETTRLLQIAKKQEKSVLFYDDLGIQQILLGVEDDAFLRYLEKNLNILEAYDHSHPAAGYTEILSYYLAYDGSVKKVAEKLFLHRNTVNYKVKQISKLLNKDLTTLESRLELLMALKIRELL